MLTNKPAVLVDFVKLKSLYTGLGQVSFQYARALAEKSSSKLDLTYLVPENFVGKFGQSVTYRTPGFLPRHFPFFNKFPEGKTPTLWHAIHQDSGYMPPGKVPYLLTIHDLNFLEEKSPLKAALRLRSLQKKVNRAAAITFISAYSESVAKRHLKINVPTRVIYNGVDITITSKPERPLFFQNYPSLSILSSLSLLASSSKTTTTMPSRSGPLYFSVGVIKEKKNFRVLIAFMKKLGRGVLVIGGDNTDPYAEAMQREIESENLQDRIIMPGIVTENDRAWLYQNCDAFLFPSRVEGFGLPVIEAMSYGKPVFLSTLSSLPEVGGGEAFYWEHFDPDYMVDIFNEKMKSAPEAEKVLARKNRAAFFNWDNAVKNYVELYEKIIWD